MSSKVSGLVVVLIFAGSVASAAKCRQPHDCNLMAIPDHEICNFHKVDNDLYRGARPTCGGLARLETLGIRTFIDLGGAEAAIAGCKDQAREAGMRFIYFHISVAQIILSGVSAERLQQLFTLIQQAPKPIFVSCSLGRDRTGMVVALYRARHGELSFDRAEREAVYYGYRTHFIGLRKAFERYRDPRELASLPAPSLSPAPPGDACFPEEIVRDSHLGETGNVPERDSAR